MSRHARLPVQRGGGQISIEVGGRRYEVHFNGGANWWTIYRRRPTPPGKPGQLTPLSLVLDYDEYERVVDAVIEQDRRKAMLEHQATVALEKRAAQIVAEARQYDEDQGTPTNPGARE